MILGGRLNRIGPIKPADALYVGLGFYWAWLFVAFYTSVLIPNANAANGLMGEIWNWAAWAHAIALVLCAFYARLLQPLAMRKTSILLSSLATSAGTLLISASADAGVSIALICGALLVGAATAWTVLSWSVLYSERGARFSLFAIIASYLLAAVIFFLVRLMMPYVAIATTALLPLLCGLTLNAARMRKAADKDPSDQDDPVQFDADRSSRHILSPRAVLPLSAIFLYSLCGEVLRGFATIPEGQSVLNEMGGYYLLGSAIGLVAMGGIFSLMPLFLHGRMSELPGIRPTLLIMAAGFLVTALTGASFFVAYAVFGAAFQCFRVLVWMYSAYVTEKAELPAFCVFGATQGFAALAVILGVPISSFLEDAVSVGAAQWHTIAAVAVFLMFASAVFVINPKDLGSAWGLMRASSHMVDFSPTDGQCAEVKTQSDETSPTREERFDFLKDEYGLTSREFEVAVLLAKGRSLPFIQSELHIAKGTAQTHLVHIYRKLGVHSRQEFIDAIEQYDAKR